MMDTLDAETMLMFLMEILPDEQERERIISEISRETCNYPQKLDHMLSETLVQ